MSMHLFAIFAHYSF